MVKLYVYPARKVSREQILKLKQRGARVLYRYPMRVYLQKSFDEIWKKDFNKKARNRVRKSLKEGVIVKEINPLNYIDEILEIHKSTPVRQGIPIHPDYLDKQKVIGYFKQTQKKYWTKTLGAFYEGKLIGYIHVFRKGNIIHLGRFMSHASYFSKAPNDLLITEMIKECQKVKGVKYFQYWFRTRSSIDHFKRTHGFKPYKEVTIQIPENTKERFIFTLKQIYDYVVAIKNSNPTFYFISVIVFRLFAANMFFKKLIASAQDFLKY